LSFVKELEPDVVVLDLSMPGIDGMKVFHQLLHFEEAEFDTVWKIMKEENNQ